MFYSYKCPRMSSGTNRSQHKHTHIDVYFMRENSGNLGGQSWRLNMYINDVYGENTEQWREDNQKIRHK